MSPSSNDAAPVPLLDLEAQNAPLRDALREAFERVLQSNRFIMGPEVEALERELAEDLGVAHAVGVSSGTDALLVSLMALGVGPGDEVVTTPFSFFATAGCIARLGARPVFVDIEPDSFNLDLRRVPAALSERAKALLPVHLFGQPCDLAALRASSEQHGIPVVEDAAQAIGAMNDDGTVAAVGALGCISFFPSKNLGGFGDGGLVTTQDAALAKRVRVLRTHGADPKYFHPHIGGNFRLDALQAAMLRVKRPHLKRWAEGRRAHAALYDRLFAEADLPRSRLAPPPRVQPGHVYNQYVIRTDRRDALRAHLKEQGIGTEIYYPRPLHLQPCFAYLGHQEGAFPHAERASREVLALPVFAELREEDVRRVAGHIVDFLRREPTSA